MIGLALLLSLAVTEAGGHQANAGVLPHCANRAIHEVARRAGCALGDDRCWLRGGGFCTDYVERRVLALTGAARVELASVPVEELAPGDVAVFAGRAHYAMVERVLRGPDGRPMAMDLAEFNFGSCWVDEALMVTDAYGVLGRRRGVPVGLADGGFLRARPLPR